MYVVLKLASLITTYLYAEAIRACVYRPSLMRVIVFAFVHFWGIMEELRVVWCLTVFLYWDYRFVFIMLDENEGLSSSQCLCWAGLCVFVCLSCLEAALPILLYSTSPSEKNVSTISSFQVASLYFIATIECGWSCVHGNSCASALYVTIKNEMRKKKQIPFFIWTWMWNVKWIVSSEEADNVTDTNTIYGYESLQDWKQDLPHKEGVLCFGQKAVLTVFTTSYRTVPLIGLISVLFCSCLGGVLWCKVFWDRSHWGPAWLAA